MVRRPQLVDVTPAAEALGIGRHQLLHAGPPVDWDVASGALRGATVGACLAEGWAGTPDEAEALAASSVIELSPCHDHGCAGPMAGIVSPSMPPWTVTDGNGRTCRSTLNEGLGKVLRYGAFGPAVTERLVWMQRCSDRRWLRPCAATGRSTPARSSPRWWRWATRATTATGAGTRCWCGPCS